MGDVDNGRIIFNSNNTEFNKQIMDFAGQDYSINDDAPDIVAEFATRIDEIQIIKKLEFFDRRLLF